MHIEEIDRLCDQFEDLLQEQATLSIEEFLKQNQLPRDGKLLSELIRVEQELLTRQGKPVSEKDYSARFPEATATWRPNPSQTVESSEPPLPVIGPYKLLQQIGEGGMGTVYMAEQQTPVRRKVALKVIKPGMDTQQVIARFEVERQALAIMDHQNIAKVFDAGATEAGRPFFVMELVRGIPITKYCDENRLTIDERIDLFTPVCQAIQHAHQKGIIHRDIKPSNVLVCNYDGQPVPKVIDFGVAKAVEQRLTEKTMFTHFGQVIGTLEYMSPEQAGMSQLDIDTRSDIYSLGVLLYELLTGDPPLTKQRLRTVGFEETMRLIREEEPRRPSMLLGDSGNKLPSLSAQRRTEPGKLGGLIRGDLDWIVIKALAKDRSRRYETASAFARDLERYTNNELVEACPPSAAYRLSKIVQKYRSQILVGLSLILLLCLGVVASTWQAVRATIAENEAEKEAARANEAEESARNAQRDAEANAEELQIANELARQHLYAAHMNLAMENWKTGNIPAAKQLLNRHLPKNDEADIRSFEWFLVHRLCYPKNMEQLQTGCNKLAVSPDGRTYATGGLKGELQLWSETGQLLFSIQAHEEQITALCFTLDGEHLVTASSDKTAKVFHISSQREIHKLVGHQSSINCVAVSNDGTLVATGCGTEFPPLFGEVRIWDFQTGRQTMVLDEFEGGVFALQFFGEEKALITGGGVYFADSELKIWDLKEKRIRHQFKPHQSTIYDVILTADESSLITCGADNAIRIWDLAVGHQLQILEGHTHEVFSVSLSVDNDTLASASRDLTVRLWDSKSGKEREILGHDSRLDQACFWRDGGAILTRTLDRKIHDWDLTEARRGSVLSCDGEVRSVAYSPSGDLLVAGHRGKFSVWESKTGRLIRENDEHDSLVGRITFSRDGTVFLTSDEGDGERGGVGRLWSAHSGKLVASFDSEPSFFRGTLSPDGNTIALASPHWTSKEPGTIHLYDRKSGTAIQKLEGHTTSVGALAYSPNGRFLATGGKDQRIVIWDVQSGKFVRELTGHRDSVTQLEFSSDGKILASVSRDRTARVWNVDTGVVIHVLKGARSILYAMGLSPDGRSLATGGWDGLVQFWDVETGELRATLDTQQQSLWAIAFSQDGSRLATASRDGTVRQWLATKPSEVTAESLTAD